MAVGWGRVGSPAAGDRGGRQKFVRPRAWARFAGQVNCHIAFGFVNPAFERQKCGNDPQLLVGRESLPRQ